MKKSVFFLFSVIVIFITSEHAYSQLLGKGKAGYIVLKGGTKMEGFVKSGATNTQDGQLVSVKYSKTKDGKYKKYPTKKLSEYSLNGTTVYMLAKIKVSLVSKKSLFCQVLYRGKTFTILKDPMSSSSGGSSLTIMDDEFGDPALANEITFHIRKGSAEPFKRVQKLGYKKTLTEWCGDNKEWNDMVSKNPKWLNFTNVVNNLKYYETNK